jgi:hypothetical protein
MQQFHDMLEKYYISQNGEIKKCLFIHSIIGSILNENGYLVPMYGCLRQLFKIIIKHPNKA